MQHLPFDNKYTQGIGVKAGWLVWDVLNRTVGEVKEQLKTGGLLSTKVELLMPAAYNSTNLQDAVAELGRRNCSVQYRKLGWLERKLRSWISGMNVGWMVTVDLLNSPRITNLVRG